MPTTAWPNADELQQFLVASGLNVDAGKSAAQQALDLDGAISAAIDSWNDMTHYWPFLSTGVTTEERRFDPNMGNLIDLNGGLVTLTSLTTGVTYSNSVGTPRTNIRDFQLLPSDAAPRKLPWNLITAIWFNWGDDSYYPGSIKIIGEWGYCTGTNLPASARRAVMALAAQSLMPQIELNLRRGGLKVFQQGDSEKQWGRLGESADMWQSMIDRALKQGFVRAQLA